MLQTSTFICFHVSQALWREKSKSLKKKWREETLKIYVWQSYSFQERENRYIRRQYSSLAVSLAHLVLIRRDEQKDSIYARDTLVTEIHGYEEQHIRRLLCWLDTLPWKQRFSCQLAMKKFEVGAKFQRMSRNRFERYLRDFVLLDYINRTIDNIEKFFLCLSQGNICYKRVETNRATVFKPRGQEWEKTLHSRKFTKVFLN